MNSPGQRPAWALLDALLVDEDRQHVAADFLTLANSDWAGEVSIDLTDGVTSGFVSRHRVTTMLGTQHVPVDQRDELLTRLRHIAGVQLRLEATAREALQILNDADVETRVLKGMASAELDYPAPHLRQSGDLDIALPAAAFDHAVRTLKHHGFRNHHTNNSDFLLKGTTLDSPTGIEIDIHTRLFQRSAMSSIIFADPEQLTQLPSAAMSPNLRLVHAAGHFILTPPGARRMSGLVDITRLRLHPGINYEAAREIAGRLQVEGLVGAALRLELELSGRPDLFHLLDGWTPPGWLDRNTRLVSARRLTLDHLNRFREVQKGERLRYIPTWLRPTARERRLATKSIQHKVQRLRTAAQSRRTQT